MNRTKTFMGVKLTEFLILSLALVTISSARDIKEVSPQLKIVTKLASETIKLIDEGSTQGDDELFRLQATSNLFQLYVQDAIHYFHESISQLKDSELKEQFIPFVSHLQEVAYGMSKASSADAQTIKKNLKDAMKGYLKLIPRAEQIIDTVSKKLEGAFAVNLNKHSYDIALFMYETVYVDIRFRRESRQTIAESIEQNLSGVFKLLDDINNNNKSEEFAAFSQLLPEFCDRIIHKIERWAYLSLPRNSTNEGISSVYNGLGELVRQFRKNARSTSSTVQLHSNVKDLFVNAAPEMRKLALVAVTLSPGEQEIYKNVLLEILSVISTIKDELEILHGKN